MSIYSLCANLKEVKMKNSTENFFKRKGISISFIAHALEVEQSSFSRRVKKDRINLNELKILRAKRIINSEDIDELTRVG